LQVDARLRHLAFTENDAIFSRVSYTAAWSMGLGLGAGFYW
jgi:hypothetical protein